MGATDTEKAELPSYQLKDVAHSWCKMYKDIRALGGVPVMWELFKTTFLERFFPREMREAKVEFINLKQGSMTVREYSLKFVKLSRYATSLVSNRLMVHVQQVEESRKRKCTTAGNRSRHA